VSHGPQRGILVARAKPTERIQTATGKMEVHDGTAPEIDEHSGGRTLNDYSAPPVDHDFGGRDCHQHGNYECYSGEQPERQFHAAHHIAVAELLA
jgi:hypothetical protein